MFAVDTLKNAKIHFIKESSKLQYIHFSYCTVTYAANNCNINLVLTQTAIFKHIQYIHGQSVQDW